MPDPHGGAPSQAPGQTSRRHGTVPAFLSRWLPIALWLVTIFYVSGIPSHRLPPMRFTLGDKVAHACAYAAGGFLIARAIPHPLTAILITAAYGASDEWHQSMVPGRDSDIADWLADCAGAVLGVGLFYFSARARNRGQRN